MQFFWRALLHLKLNWMYLKRKYFYLRLQLLQVQANMIGWRCRKYQEFKRRRLDKFPRYKVVSRLGELKKDRWDIEWEFWIEGPDASRQLFMRKFKWHWYLRRLWVGDLKSDAVSVVYRARYRAKELRKRFLRWRKGIPTVCVIKNNGITAVVLKRDLEKAKHVFIGYKSEEFAIRKEPYFSGAWGMPFVPGRTMLFAKPATQAIGLRRPSAEIVSGTMDDMKELLRGCAVETHARQSLALFVPYSGFTHTLDWQKEQFPRLTLGDAYHIVWGQRRMPPKAQ